MTKRSWLRSLFALPTVSPARRPRVEVLEDRLVPATFHVTSLLDDGNPGTLRAAINQANANPGLDAIDFQVTGTISLNGSELPTISDDLTITAPAVGLTVDAHQASRILEVNTSASAGVWGLTLVNGSADQGGAIFNNGTLSLTACTFSGNLARDGGGIFNNGGNLGLDRVTLDSNTARGADGAALGPPGQDARGGGLFNSGGAVTISDSSLTNNSAQGGAEGSGGFGGAGGAALGGGACSLGGSLELMDSTLTGNSARAGAGGDARYLYLVDGGQGGSAQGGAVFASGATAVTLTNSTLSGNIARAGDGGRGGSGGLGFGANGGYGQQAQGGGLFAQNCASVTITNSTVLQNTARGGDAGQGGIGYKNGGPGGVGGLAQGGGLSLFANGAVTLTQSTIASNTAEGGAGGVGGGSSGFQGLGGPGGRGGATQGGGMCLDQGGPATIISTTFSGNTARGGDAGDGGGSVGEGVSGGGGFGGNAQGGAVLVNAVSVQFAQATLANNVVQGGAGGLPGVFGRATGFEGEGGGAFGAGLFSTATVALTNSTIAYGSATAGAGGPQLLAHPNAVSQGGNFYNAGSATLNNTLIAGSLAGGDVYSAGNLVGHSSLIQDPSNQPLTDGALGNIIGHDPLLGTTANYGGPTAAVALLAGSPAIDAGDPGLAVDAQGNPLTTDQRGAPFVRSYGAGVDIGAFERQTVLVGPLVVNTAADETVSAPGVLSLREAIGLANAAPGSTITFAPGVFGTPQTITLTRGELPAVVANVTITGPGARLLAASGSDLYRILTIDDQASEVIDVTISGLTLTRGNPNGGVGGALCNYEDLTLIDSTISGSTARLGGGIFNYGALNLSGCTVSGNAAAYQGSDNLKLFLYDTVSDCLGGGIFNLGTATLTNSTLANNRAVGAIFGFGGGLLSFGPATLTNCTVTGNTAYSAAANVVNFGGGINAQVLTVNNTLIAGNTGGDILADYTGAGNWIGGDPMLDAAGLRNNGGPTDTVALLAGSPAIDAGDVSLAVDAQGNPLTTDQRGAPFVRSYGAGVDIGAFESQAAPNKAPTAGVTGPAAGVTGQALTFILTATDPGAVDVAAGFTFTVNWADGSPVQVIGPGALSGATASHVYTTAGNSYTVSVTATDSHGLAGSAVSTTVVLSAIQFRGGVLAVGGTTGNDTIRIDSSKKGRTLILNGATSGPYAGATAVQVYGQAGDDQITVTDGFALPVLLDGGAGDDTLRAGKGDGILLGGPGDDQLYGGGGRDLLIGGLGSDTLHSGTGDDILIGGTTDYDGNPVALDALMAEWTRTDAAATYAVRIGRLRDGSPGGLNGAYRLNATTVHDDAAVDSLLGGQGMDWYFALVSGPNADRARSKNGEVVTAL